jgi:hypothetical protein
VTLILSRRMGKSGSSLASATGPRLTLLDLTLRNGCAGPFCFDGGLYDGKLKLRTGGLKEDAEALRRRGCVAGAKTSSFCRSMYDWRRLLISSCSERPKLSRFSPALISSGVCWKVSVEIERCRGPMAFEAGVFLVRAKAPLDWRGTYSPNAVSQILATFSGVRGVIPRRFGFLGGTIGGAVRSGARGARSRKVFAGSMLPESSCATLSGV